MSWASGIHPTADGYPSGLPFYICGPNVISGVCNLTEHGHIKSSGTSNLFANGHIPSLDNIDLFEHGYIESSGEIELFECGHCSVSGINPTATGYPSGLPLFEHGHMAISGGYQDDEHGIRGFYLSIVGSDSGTEAIPEPNVIADTWATNLQPKLKALKLFKLLSATPTTPGEAVTGTVYVFNKNCPFAGRIVGVRAISKSLTTADFNGAGGSVSLTVQTSDEIDVSPGPPTTPVWDTLIPAVSCKDKASDSICLDAPWDGANLIDQSYNTIPCGGSMKATLTAQVENGYSGDGSLIEILIIVEYLPTDVRARYC